jgi:hypothetical protein
LGRKCIANLIAQDGIKFVTYIEKNGSNDCEIDSSRDSSHIIEIENCKPNRIKIRITSTSRKVYVVYQDQSGNTRKCWEVCQEIPSRQGRNAYKIYFDEDIFNNPLNKVQINNDDLDVTISQNDPAWSQVYRHVIDLHLEVSTA